MTTKEFIECAIEGGWKITYTYIDAFDIDGQLVLVGDYCIYLDPLAWQAVGKVGGLPTFTNQNGTGYVGAKGPAVDYKYHMHRMVNVMCEGMSIEQFLETL